MDAWQLNASLAELVLDAALLGGAMIVATVLRGRVGFLQRYLIPNALVAGFLGLILGPELLGLVPFSLERMGAYVYHLLALTFICVGLHGGGQRKSYGAINLGFMQVMCMLLQGLVGLAIAFLFVALIDPDFAVATGVLLPLGFAMGPGVAYSIGAGWSAFGFADGASVGLSLAAVGFLIAYVIGVWLVHREGHADGIIPESVRTGLRRPEDQTVAGMLTLSPAAVEPLAVHVGVVAALYAATYGLATVLAAGLTVLGAASEVPVVWSFHFILANLMALGVRRLLAGTRAAAVLDDGLLHRMTGVTADFLIAASIMAISLAVAWRYAAPIALMAVAGTAVTFAALRLTSRWVFRSWRFERFVGMFGEMTGTITSGLALVRILDPEFRSPVAQDLVLSSGVALMLAFPLLVAINLPYSLFDGALAGFATLAGVMLAYLGLIAVAWRVFFRRTRGLPSADS